jgi:sec-independent protein translocase protein TatA
MGLGGLGMWEMMLIFLVVLLLFGAKRLPEIGSSLGKGIREFKGSIREIEREVQAPPAPRESVTAASSDDAEQDEEPRTLTTSPDVDRSEGPDA